VGSVSRRRSSSRAISASDVDPQDSERLLVFAFETGVELGDRDFANPALATVRALRAERARIQGRPQDALSIVDPPLIGDDLAVAALAQADLGDFDRAHLRGGHLRASAGTPCSSTSTRRKSEGRGDRSRWNRPATRVDCAAERERVMADIIQTVTERGFFENVKNAIVGALLGVVLFFASFVVLYWNEGTINKASLAKTSIAVSPDKVEPAAEGKFASLTGPIQAKEDLGDEGLVKPGPWVRLVRHVQTFAWDEKKSTESHSKVGGGTEEVTTYKYEKEWVDSVSDSTKFQDPKGHENPQALLPDADLCVAQATVGAYSFSPKDGEGVDTSDALDLTKENAVALVDSSKAATASTIPALSGRATRLESDPKAKGNYLFVGKGSSAAPEIGDTRISYSMLARGATVTLFGLLKAASVVPYPYASDASFQRALPGSREQAIHTLAVEDAIKRWIFRAIGFFCMWFGMTLVLGPLEAVANILPIAGKATHLAIGCITFPIALVLSTATIVVSMILHSLVATVLVGLVLFGIVLAVFKMRGKPAAAA
jgi:hypothetical protein